MKKKKAVVDNRIVTTMRMPGALLDRLGRQAEREGRSRNNLAEHLITAGLKNRVFSGKSVKAAAAKAAAEDGIFN